MSPPERIVTVWCADWPVVAAAVAGSGTVPGGAPGAQGAPDGAGAGVPGRPIAVVRAERVLARSPAAAVAGVRVGQRRRDAQRCCPELELVDHDPARDARAFEPVVRAVAEVAPRIDVVEPGHLQLAARGPARYFGGDRVVAERLAGIVAALLARSGAGSGAGSSVGVGVADGRVASTIAARRAAARALPGAGVPDVAAPRAGVEIVEPGRSPTFLAPLPVTWLRATGDADADLVDVWMRLGLSTLGAVAALSAPDVLSRFGPAGAHAHRVATGHDPRPLVAVEPAPGHQVTHTFEVPVDTVSTVVFAAKRLADRAVADLAAVGQVCTRIVVAAETDHGERSERSWYRDAGLSAAAIVERVRWQLDGWIGHPPGITAGIVLVRLVVEEVRADVGVQPGLWGGRTRADEAAARAVTRLAGLVGDAAVQVPTWRGGRLPDERYAWVPASSVDPDRATGRVALDAAPWPGAASGIAPTVVPAAPVEVDLLDRAGERVRVGGRGEVSGEPATLVTGGGRAPIAAWAGPWPVEQGWWDPRRRRRVARLQVVTADGDAHLIAAEHRRWWILASYC